METNLLIIQTSNNGLPIYDHSFSIYHSLKENCWLYNQTFDVITVNEDQSLQDVLKTIDLSKYTYYGITGSVQFCYSHYNNPLSLKTIFDNIPFDFIKRKVWYGTKKHIKPNVFIKPLSDVKLFTGYVSGELDLNIFDMVTDYKVKEDTELFFSEPIDVYDEYRVWYNNGIKSVKHYLGPMKYYLDMNVVNDCNEYIKSKLKTKFVADYGIAKIKNKMETVLIEVNDIHGTGTYGFNDFNLWNIIKTKTN